MRRSLFVDSQIGRFLEQLKENPRGRETFVMVVSDHGWHLGEKKHWCKGAIWEQTTHIPFIVRGPGIETGSTCTQPVSLIDVYPSLVDLAGLKSPELVRQVSKVTILTTAGMKVFLNATLNSILFKEENA